MMTTASMTRLARGILTPSSTGVIWLTLSQDLTEAQRTLINCEETLTEMTRTSPQTHRINTSLPKKDKPARPVQNRDDEQLADRTQANLSDRFHGPRVLIRFGMDVRRLREKDCFHADC